MHGGKPTFQRQEGAGRIYYREGAWATNEEDNYNFIK